jgi:hypothetical protein
MPAERLVCPCCGTTLDRDTVRPPCANGCRTPEGFRRLSEMRMGQTFLCGECLIRAYGVTHVEVTAR